MKKALLWLSVTAAVFCVLPAPVLAGGTNTIPYYLDFENMVFGTSITSVAGWYVGDADEIVIVTNHTVHGKVGAYFARSTHTNAVDLGVMGAALSNVFSLPGEGNERHFTYIDLLLKPQGRDEPMDFEGNEPLIAAFVSTNNELWVKYAWYKYDYIRGWTNTGMYVETNAWVRLSFTLDLFGAYDDPYYQLRVNGGAPWYVEPSNEGYDGGGYADPENPSQDAPDGGTWLMCCNAGQGKKQVTSVSIEGLAQVDDFAVSDVPVVSIVTNYTTITNGEGHVASTNGSIVLELSGIHHRDVAVSLAATNGTAFASSNDFMSAPVTVTFSPMTLYATGVVYAMSDKFLEGTEYFRVSLTNASNAVVYLPSTATVNILDDGGYTSGGTPWWWLVHWSLATNGSTPSQYETADASDVGDGDSNPAGTEYAAGTIPNDPESVFKIVAVSSNTYVKWIGGATNSLGRPFSDFWIYRSTNIANQAGWTFVTNVTRASSGTNEWTDPDAASFVPKVFYRVIAPQ